jgi:GNAT superfamily N-acetyltransferase
VKSDRSLGLRIEQLPYTHPVVQALVEEVQQEYVARYGGPDGAPMEEEMFDPPTGAFYVAFRGDEPVATGAWRTRDGDEDVAGALGGSRVAEIKRMYVRADARRAGVARAVLTHLETTAAEAGADVLVLETGTAQPEAIRLYESSGNVRVAPFGYYKGYPSARHFGKRLRPVAGAAAGGPAALGRDRRRS